MTKKKMMLKLNLSFRKIKIFAFALAVLALPLFILATTTIERYETRSQAAAPKWYYFSQYGSKWQTSNCKIATYGCFPTALAMTLKKFYPERSHTPLSVAKAIGAGCKSGTNVVEQKNAMSGFAREKGLETIRLSNNPNRNTILEYGSKNFNYTRAKSWIDKGYLLILSGCMRYFNSNNTLARTPRQWPHAVVAIDVYPSTRKIVVLDPTKEWGIRKLTSDSIKTCPGVVNGWVSAYAVKKQ